MLFLCSSELGYSDKAISPVNNHKKVNFLAIVMNLLGKVCGEPIHGIEVLHRYIQPRGTRLRLGGLQLQATGAIISMSLNIFSYG